MSDILKYFRQDRLPHIWCPGCGHGTVTGALVRAIARLKLDKNKVCVVSGIGCSSRAPGYLDFDTLHTAHGRALAFATGIKLARPDLKVIVMTGDGDCTAIGGNHFIHAARRNIDITTIVMNNNIYGMTSGQYSPMTPKGFLGTTAPYGNPERTFDLCKLAEAAGATYVARGTSFHAQMLIDLIEQALTHRGFSVVEALTQCPTYFGRKNKVGGAVELLEWIKERTVNAKAAAVLPPEKVAGKLLIGELHKNPQPEFCDEYDKIIAQVQRKFEGFRGGVRGCEQNSD
ncbi:MAG TPA: 2-oxoacid:ferredoxin oxidoreductase subunit beta [Spirochaetia bacterium]|nr:2-oxoacid:ferredoxin oxidoreductase subunit beta [Spirochaetales bacterium]HRY80967.1 2-oxoacid:ferredoxin oxidoreductase subunit beta [Spirochaetia bacterium]HRZ87937.1 2-oxoacid:ferredoxin oxidoreductase subunit beta [Spirochaetia bacterium]